MRRNTIMNKEHTTALSRTCLCSLEAYMIESSSCSVDLKRAIFITRGLSNGTYTAINRSPAASEQTWTHVLPAGFQLPGCDVLFWAVGRPRPQNLIHHRPEEEHDVVCCALRVRLRHIVAGCGASPQYKQPKK